MTVDRDLMRYIFDGIIPCDPCVSDRVIRASNFFASHNNNLVCLGKTGWRVIPPIAERWFVIDEFHSFGHISADRLYVTIKQKYFWKNLREDCVAFCKRCLGCQRENAKYVKHPTL